MTDDALQEAAANLLRTEPWHAAEDWSFWRITGTYPTGGGFRDCLAICLPRHATGGGTLFQLLPLLDGLVAPDQISHGIEMQLIERYPEDGVA